MIIPVEDVTHLPQDIYSVPDRVTGIQGWEELRRAAPERTWNFASVSTTSCARRM